MLNDLEMTIFKELVLNRNWDIHEAERLIETTDINMLVDEYAINISDPIQLQVLNILRAMKIQTGYFKE